MPDITNPLLKFRQKGLAPRLPHPVVADDVLNAARTVDAATNDAADHQVALPRQNLSAA
jgi:hypothetical protein